MEALKAHQERLDSMEKKLESQESLLQEARKLAQFRHEAAKDEYLTPQSPSSSSNVTVHKDHGRRQLQSLIDRLDIDDEIDIATEDTSELLRLIHTLSIPSQDRAAALISSQRLEYWVTDGFSRALHVNGHMNQSEHETRRSPLSYVCAKLVDSALSSTAQSERQAGKGTFAVRWFCGQHTYMVKDPDAHPKGMMNNLLAQLVTQLLACRHPSHLDRIDLPDGDLEVTTLCKVFSSMVKRLAGGTTLFCIIDGISYYEDRARREECHEVLSMLLNLMRSCQGGKDGCMIKLLVTAPLRSRLQREVFAAEDVLDMDEYITPGGGFTARQWDLGVGKAMKQ